MKYSTYILTAWETELEIEFSTKKELMSYLANSTFTQKDAESMCVLAFKLDKDGYQTALPTKYSFDNRFN